MPTSDTDTITIHRTFDAALILLDMFECVGYPLPKKWDDFFETRAWDWHHTPEDERCLPEELGFKMSLPDAKALRNHADKAVRMFIKQNWEGGDYEEQELLERLRDDLDEGIAGFAA